MYRLYMYIYIYIYICRIPLHCHHIPFTNARNYAIVTMQNALETMQNAGIAGKTQIKIRSIGGLSLCMRACVAGCVCMHVCACSCL